MVLLRCAPGATVRPARPFRSDIESWDKSGPFRQRPGNVGSWSRPRNDESPHCVEAGFAQALGGFEIDQVVALDALVFGIVLAHVSDLMP